MKLKAKLAAWSSVVGGGVLLYGPDGNMVGQIAILCHTNAFRDKEAQAGLSRIICDAINASGEPK